MQVAMPPMQSDLSYLVESRWTKVRRLCLASLGEAGDAVGRSWSCRWCWACQGRQWRRHLVRYLWVVRGGQGGWLIEAVPWAAEKGKLMEGVHPRTNLPMPSGIDEKGMPFTFASGTSGVYANALAYRSGSTPVHQVPPPPLPYQAAETTTISISSSSNGGSGVGKTARQKMNERVARIRLKEASGALSHLPGTACHTHTPEPLTCEPVEPTAKIRRRCRSKQPG